MSISIVNHRPPREAYSDNHNGHSRVVTRHLTPMEIHTVELLSEHLCSNAELAKIMNVTIDTVKKHLSLALDKTGTFNRLELVVKWQRQSFQDWMRSVGIR